MAFSHLRDEMNCGVCHEAYKDPIMLPCGHNFCLICIEKTWDGQKDMGEVPSCPECRQTYKTRPDLKKNLKLCNIVKCFLNINPTEVGIQIFCCDCTSRVAAVKSCLHCEASLCDYHVRKHSKSPEHVFTDPTTYYLDRKCSKHKKILEFYCPEDGVCICSTCSLVGDHEGHKVEPLSEASEKKKEKLREILEKLSPEREETERQIQRLQERLTEVGKKEEAETERVTELFKDIREQLEALEKQVMWEISRQKGELANPFTDVLEQLEIKKDKLCNKIHHIEELCNMADPLTVLQERESHGAEFCGVNNEEADNEGGRERDDIKAQAVGDLDVGLISETLLTGLHKIVSLLQERTQWQEAKDLLLDNRTATNYTVVSDDRKTVSYAQTDPPLPQTPHTIHYPYILSIKKYNSGRHYWTVEISELGQCGVGVAYPLVKTHEGQSLSAHPKNSWGIIRRNNQYLIINNSKETLSPLKSSYNRIRIWLDYEAGRLSFYELSEPIRHLRTFTVTFTEPLHAAFWVMGDNGSVKIIV